LVYWLLLGSDGIALRAWGNERRLDGSRRRAHRVREVDPVRRTATYGTAAILFVLGGLLVAAPDTIPALTIPGSGSISPMNQMSP
jgi:hypothetical protein